jgi:hypothetical protein
MGESGKAVARGKMFVLLLCESEPMPSAMAEPPGQTTKRPGGSRDPTRVVYPHDAHRPVHPNEDLAQIFTWQEKRTMTRNLVVHFRRVPTSAVVSSPQDPREHFYLAGMGHSYLGLTVSHQRPDDT